MLHVNFSEANAIIGTPGDWSTNDCGSVNAWQGQIKLPSGATAHGFVLCLQPSREDIDAQVDGKPLWLTIFGNGLPPSSITTEKPDFPIPVPRPCIEDLELPQDILDGAIKLVSGGSMCWTEQPQGSFNSKMAEGFCLEFLQFLHANYTITVK